MNFMIFTIFYLIFSALIREGDELYQLCRRRDLPSLEILLTTLPQTTAFIVVFSWWKMESIFLSFLLFWILLFDKLGGYDDSLLKISFHCNVENICFYGLFIVLNGVIFFSDCKHFSITTFLLFCVLALGFHFFHFHHFKLLSALNLVLWYDSVLFEKGS